MPNATAPGPKSSRAVYNGNAGASVIVKPTAFQNPRNVVRFQEESNVKRVLEEVEGADLVTYKVKFEDGHIESLPFDSVMKLPGGPIAISNFSNNEIADSSSSTSETLTGRDEIEEVAPRAKRRKLANTIPGLHNDGSSEDELFETGGLQNDEVLDNDFNEAREISSEDSNEDSLASDDSLAEIVRSSRRQRAQQDAQRKLASKSSRREGLRNSGGKGRSHSQSSDEDEDDSEPEFSLLKSDIQSEHLRGRDRPSRRNISSRTSSQAQRRQSSVKQGRQSDRTTRTRRNMEEVGIEDIYRSDSDRPKAPPKAVGAREAFQPLPSSNSFHLRHCQQCDVCGYFGTSGQGQLIHCQGCSLSYHQSCLGSRNAREHLVTKVGEANFVLQCRRCINSTRRKEVTAPDQGMCQVCQEIGPACHPFRERKTAMQEEREREQNGGDDPIVDVEKGLINNVKNVLFRCMGCRRGFHFHHLPTRHTYPGLESDEQSIAEERFKEYEKEWQCIDCLQMPAKVSAIVAWRPVNQDTYKDGFTVQDMNEDEKEYLIKWENISYFQARWMPGAWVWGITAPALRRAFAKKNNSHNLPTMRIEDAIPEDYLRIDVILDVKFTNKAPDDLEEVLKARIREVDRALIKYKGLGYEDAVWEKVPGPDDLDRWEDFVVAYNEWVVGKSMRVPKAKPLANRLEKARQQQFKDLEKETQPNSLRGGTMMDYQVEGMNWLYYKWWARENGVLADEMGLGKTIQVISLIATLVEDHQCFPFLVVVPNSTCPNWRREIRTWAPTLRVVTYFGSSAARNLVYNYEMFPNRNKELKAHVVVTSYDTAIDESSRRFFKSISWQGLIVDEGQRLKNDKNILYSMLSTLKVPFRVLLTGTPLQNNARELFNLLQFLDGSFDAAGLEEEYQELHKDNIPQLHSLIKPFVLRRTKTEVLKFLPPMAQVIVPVSMSILQQTLYKSILAKNKDLIKRIFDSSRPIGKGERANLSNILMQLRKCLSHPFVYSKDIEERSVTAAISHRNLVEASSKLQLLDRLLPKLKERGHRVLIFSQFLDMLDILEDFLDGLAMQYQRLDGSVPSLEKQKRIDAFNAPNSSLFAFLLSTRAGGVGINLASADTVIILDPDFNPHVDIQALSRAHRIGQEKKVLCFQVMTRKSAEEKIFQVSKKKMVLDHVLIDKMGAEEDEIPELESILRYGAADILEDKMVEEHYDDAAIDKLLDRSQVENTGTSGDKTAESQFSFARVWANDTGTLKEMSAENGTEKTPDPTMWDKIIEEREKAHAEEAALRQQALGRGKRTRQTVHYGLIEDMQRPAETDGEEDTDFKADDKSEDESEPEEDGEAARQELQNLERPFVNVGSPSLSQQHTQEPFRRAKILWPSNAAGNLYNPGHHRCYACGIWHQPGYCPLKLAGPEYCNLCGLAHFGVSRSCPHIQSETQVREMLATLKNSPEPKALVDLATKYLGGVKGSIVQEKKRRAEKAARLAATGNTVTPAHVPRNTSDPNSTVQPTLISTDTNARHPDYSQFHSPGLAKALGGNRHQWMGPQVPSGLAQRETKS